MIALVEKLKREANAPPRDPERKRTVIPLRPPAPEKTDGKNGTGSPRLRELLRRGPAR